MKAQWTDYQSPLAAWIKRYLACKRALGRRFDNEDKTLRLLDRYLVEENIGHIAQFTPQHIETFLVSRPRKGARSYNHLLGVIRRLFDWLVLQEVIERSPVRSASRRVTAQRIPFIFDPLCARLLQENAAGLSDNSRAPDRGKTYQVIFALLYGLGLRVGEVSRLCLKNVDFNRNLLVISHTKFAKSRLVPFGPKMTQLLHDYINHHKEKYGPLQPNQPLFSFDKDRNRPIHPCTISQVFHALIPKLDLTIPEGVSAPRLHDLRHSFAVGVLLRWYRRGLDPSGRLMHLSTFMGHVDPASTAVYLTITADLIEEARIRFERFAAPLLMEIIR
jgi:site-specific recombinase XerD